MMSMNKGSLDYWRNYFGAANSDIFGIIDHAIMVAASDHPKEFRLRRDRIAGRLFSCRLSQCLGCERIELAASVDDDGAEFEFETGASKESKVSSTRDDPGEMNMNQVSNYSYGEAEALTDEIEEQSYYVEEVFRIKDLLLNCQEESESELFDSLRRLQLIELTVDLLQATEIGKAVNPLRKHGSRDISKLAQTLIDGWKEMVDGWVKATTAIAGSEGTPDSVSPSFVDDEEGLPAPPMDEGALFAAPTGSMELSQFFDGMDDDGNPRHTGELIKKREHGRRPSLNSQNTAKRKPQSSNEANNTIAKDSKDQLAKKNEAPVRRNKPVTADSSHGRPPKSTLQKKGNIEQKIQQNTVKSSILENSHIRQLDKFKGSDNAAVQVKLEATKRKLQERYQQAEKAKRQRTVQVMELHDLPKQGIGHRNPHVKSGNHKKQWCHGRR